MFKNNPKKLTIKELRFIIFLFILDTNLEYEYIKYSEKLDREIENIKKKIRYINN